MTSADIAYWLNDCPEAVSERDAERFEFWLSTHNRIPLLKSKHEAMKVAFAAGRESMRTELIDKT